jgi:iron complex outermembrane receptor protein
MVRAKRIGFGADSARITIAGTETKTLDFALTARAFQVAGVTVTGYGTQNVRNITGSVKAVTTEEFNPGRIVSPEQLIQAKVPGVQVVDNNEPGGGISLRIRGGTSVNASNEPLFVIDGVPLNIGGGLSSGRNPLNFLNPADIKEVTVLKDASATAIYGSRGANGVVMITTRSGSSSEPAFSYGTSFSSSNVAATPNLLNAQQFRDIVTTNVPANVGLLGSANTNWVDQILRSAGGAEHNLAVSGVLDDMRYRLSLGLLNQDGILQGTNASRISGSATYSDVLLNDRLELRANFKGTRNKDLYTPGGVLGQAVNMDPTQAPITGGTYFQWPVALGTNNPIADLNQLSDEGVTFRSVGNVEAKWFFSEWVEGLSGSMRAGYDYSTSTRTFFSPSTAQQDIESGRNGRIDRNTPRQLNTVLEIFGNYNRELGFMESTLDLTGGYTYEEQAGDYASFWAEDLSTDLLGANGIPLAGESQNNLFVEDSKLISFFGRANWSIRDRYLFMASLRRDGSSRFGPENQWGLFPALSAAWRVSEEEWFAGRLNMSDLKVRLSWGVNGSQAFGNYLYVPTYTPSGAQATYQFGNQFVSTLRPSAVDPNIKWEETSSLNFGVDFGFLNDRITGTIDMYNKTTNDLIFSVPVAAGTAVGNFVTTNIGSMNNKGIEIGLSAVVLDGASNGIRYEAQFAISSNRNEITSISADASDRILTGGIAGGVGSRVQVLQPGSPINSFYVYEHKKGANGKPVVSTNDLDMYVDRNEDGIINQDDLRAYKDPAPRMIIGHTSNVSYGKWDFSATARAYLGAHVYNNVASNLGHLNGLLGATPSNRHASVLETPFVNPQYFSDIYVEDASFLRLDNISAAYTFRNILGARSVRLFGTIQNVFTTSKYSGADPLAGVNGIDNNLFPLSRTYTFGANLAF